MKVAVVTGMARTAGIGHAICTTLLKHGLTVIGFDINPIEPTSPLPTSYPHRFRSRECAVDSDPARLRRNLKSALEELGQTNVHVVVNNAGLASPYMPEDEGDGEDGSNSKYEMNEEEREVKRLESRLLKYDRYLQVNLRSAFLVTEVCKPFFPPPLQSSPQSSTAPTTPTTPSVSIIHISSTRAHSSERGPSVSQEGYASAKAGMTGLTHAQGQSMAGWARVNTILPGWIDVGGYVPTEDDKAWHATGRVGRTEDIGEMVAFLADEEKSGFVTCQELVVDGGVSRRMYYP